MFAEDIAACASVQSQIKGLDVEDTEQTCNLTQYVKGRERGLSCWLMDCPSEPPRLPRGMTHTPGRMGVLEGN